MSLKEGSSNEGHYVSLPERIYRWVFRSRHSDLLLALTLLAIASIPRLFYITRDIHPNGVDEGIQIMVGRMAGAGYDLFDQLKPMQTPLMFSIYGAIEGDPVIFRLFSTAASLVIMAIVMWAAHRIGKRYTMVAAGAFMAMDLMFLHESRLASLDMFCLLWVVIGIAALVKYRQSGERWALIIMGVMFAISAMIKLFGTIAAVSAGLILFIDMVSDLAPFKNLGIRRFLPPRRVVSIGLVDLATYSLSFLLIVLVIMARFGISDVVQGAFLDQFHRPILPFSMKLTFFGVFLLLNALHVPFMFFGFRPLYRRPEGVIIPIALLYLLFFIFQATTWVHHLIFLSPTISLTAGMGVIRVGSMLKSSNDRMRLGRLRGMSPKTMKRTMVYIQVSLVLFAALLGGGFSIMVKQRGESAQRQAASLVEDLTDKDDFVISGDPLIPAIADRPVPPNVVNVASLQYPELTSDELNQTVISYGVEVVVMAYHLNEMDGFRSFVISHFRKRAHFIDNSLPILEETVEYEVYTLPQDSVLRLEPLWGTQHLPSYHGDDGA